MTASTFAKALSQEPSRRPGPPCPVAAVLARLNAGDRRDAELALVHGNGVQAPQLVRAFQALGHTLDKQQIGNHRRRDCRCGIEERRTAAAKATT